MKGFFPARKQFFWLVVAFLFIFSVLGWYIQVRGPETPEQFLVRVEQSARDSRTLEGALLGSVQTRGIPFALSAAFAATKQKKLSDDDCHTLLHLIGNEAYAQSGVNFDQLLAPILGRGNLCLGGYVHGIEADIAAEGIGAKEILWAFCAKTKEAHVNLGPCYHGVGHAVFEDTKDIRQSLAFCDALTGGPETDLTACYRGVFSEVGNELLGFDTHSAFTIPPLRLPHISNDDPLPYCETVATRYQYSCYSQLSKILFGKNISSANPPALCLSATQTELGRMTCVATVTGLATRFKLPSSLAEAVSVIEGAPIFYRLAALKGFWDTELEAKNMGVGYPWTEACALLSDSSYQALCRDFPQHGLSVFQQNYGA